MSGDISASRFGSTGSGEFTEEGDEDTVDNVFSEGRPQFGSQSGASGDADYVSADEQQSDYGEDDQRQMDQNFDDYTWWDNYDDMLYEQEQNDGVTSDNIEFEGEVEVDETVTDGVEGGDQTLEDFMNADENTMLQEIIEEGDQKTEGMTVEEEAKESKKTPVDVSTFRYFERKVLAEFIPIRRSEENLRRHRLLQKCSMLRKVDKPLETLFAGKLKSIDSSIKADGDGDAGSTEGRQYSEKEWAMKNTIDFLTKAGCTYSSSDSYRTSLLQQREKADIRLELYEKQLQRRRKGIGTAQQAPEITAALRRHAERAIWRGVIDNTKPRYPLPRFIISRHKYLKKVQAQFIGPGTYDVDVYETQVRRRQLRLPSTWNSCTSRFPKEKVDDSGAPPLLDPYEKLDEANHKYKHPGVGIPFESTPKNFRCSSMINPGSGVPPSAYEIKSPLEEFVTRVTSTRGPYDCYTPSRAVIPYGHYKSPNLNEMSRLGPGSFEVRTSLVKEMNDSYNCFKGAFGKAKREAMFGFKAAFDKPLWPRDNHIPPVGLYDPAMNTIGQDRKQFKAPFQVQAGLKVKDLRNPALVAADYFYYAPGSTWTEPIKGADLASVFHSKAPQIMPSKFHHITKERNKALNRKIDLEAGVAVKEEHYVPDEPTRNIYVLENCKDKCMTAPGGGKLDEFAIPGYGVIVDEKGRMITGKDAKCCACK